jgi:hypothetical protein
MSKAMPYHLAVAFYLYYDVFDDALEVASTDSE